MSAPLTGQVALITGASRGIGRAMAVELGRRGMAVGLVGRNRTQLDAALRATVEAGARAVAVPADVTVRGEITEAVEVIERDLGPVDLLVNNAARIEQHEVPPWEADPTEWWAVVEASLLGAFLTARAVVPGMVARGRGRVVDMTSGIAVDRRSVYSGYAVAKAGLLRFTAALAAAGAEHGVRAFDVSPGSVRTDMTAGMAMHVGRTDWTPVEDVVELVAAIAAGDLDELSGRFLRAGADTVGDLRAWGSWIVQSDARVVALRRYGTDDPLGG